MKHRIATKTLAIILAAGMSLGLGACGNTDGNNSGDAGRISADQVMEDNQASSGSSSADSSSADSSSASATSADSSQAGAASESKRTEYPLTITTTGPDGQEFTTTYEKAPEKVVAVYQGSIETLLALGLEDRIVAAAGLDNEVPDDMKAAFSGLNYLDEFTPSKETVTMLEPDMIFSWVSLFRDTTLGSPQEWIDKGTNVYINTNTATEDSLENEYNDILNIGKIFDVQDRAEALVNEMKNTIETVKEKTAGESDSPSAMVVEFQGDSIANYGAVSEAGDMITQLGGTLANPDASAVGKEDIISANPDVIFVVYMPYTGDDPDTVMQENLNQILSDEAFASLSAVQNGRVVPIMLSEMYASATRTQDGIETIAQGLYPDIDLSE